MDRTVRRRRLRTVGAAIAVAASLSLTGCGFNAQTLQTYTPAHGVNVDHDALKVRNLLVIADGQGKGVVSASIVSAKDDSLESVSGNAVKADGSDGGALTVTAAPVELPAGQLVVLTDQSPRLTVTGPELKPGLTARLVLTYGSGQTTDLVVPVMDAEQALYADAVQDTAAPSASASPTPEPTQSP